MITAICGGIVINYNEEEERRTYDFVHYGWFCYTSATSRR